MRHHKKRKLFAFKSTWLSETYPCTPLSRISPLVHPGIIFSCSTHASLSSIFKNCYSFNTDSYFIRVLTLIKKIILSVLIFGFQWLIFTLWGRLQFCRITYLQYFLIMVFSLAGRSTVDPSWRQWYRLWQELQVCLSFFTITIWEIVTSEYNGCWINYTQFTIYYVQCKAMYAFSWLSWGP